MEDQIRDTDDKVKSGGWVRIEEHEELLLKLDDTEYELEVTKAELDALGEDLVELHLDAGGSGSDGQAAEDWSHSPSQGGSTA